MATIRNLEQSEKVIFTKVGTLLKQLRDIPNARSTFSIENGIEYYTNAELGKALIRAAKKSPSFSGNQASKQIESLANVLEKCKKNLQACEEIIGRAMQINSWTLELEEEMSDSWRMFSITFSDASTMLESGELDLLMLLGKPESSTSKRHDADAGSVLTATNQSWHSKGSFTRLFQSKNQRTKMNKISKQQIGSNQTLAPGPSIQNPPDMMDAISDPGLGPAPVIKNGSQHLNPSVRSGSPPPQYTEVGKISSLKHKSPSSQNLRPIQSVLSQDPQGPLSRFSTRVDLIPPAQPGAQTFFAEHIHMYHGCPPTQYPGNMFPGAPPTATWQPIWQPPPPPPGPPLFVPPPLAYKSSAYSLRETLATEFLDLIKPDASCVHGVRHYKKHSSCPWGCCWQRGCFNGC